MRGQVLFYDAANQVGIISGVDENRYSFRLGDLRHPSPPRIGMSVDYVPTGETARDIFPVPGNGGADYGFAAPASDDTDIGLFGYFCRTITRDYARFSGRARRREYWGFVLFYLIGLLVTSLFAFILIGSTLERSGPSTTQVFFSPVGYMAALILALAILAMIIPSLAVTVRRLHDIGQSGWLVLIGIVPVVNLAGGVVLFAMMLLDSQPGTNRHGPPPKPLA